MEKAVVLALAASFCTATSSVCQRLGARSTPSGFDIFLLFRLARRPVWLLGIASMILGFVLQVSALRFGGLALVQPILALELIFVFGYMAIIGSRPVRRRDWMAAVAMCAGLGLFLFVSSPSAAGCTRRPRCGGWPGWSRRRPWRWGWRWPSAWAGGPVPRGPAGPRCSAPPPGSPGASSPR